MKLTYRNRYKKIINTFISFGFIVSLIHVSNDCVAAELTGIDSIKIVETIKSSSGEDVAIQKDIKAGETYTNKSEQYARLFISDKVGGSLEKGASVKVLSKSQQRKKKLVLDLLKGTARFRVKKMKRETFKVKTPTAVVGVRGTLFSIYIEGDGKEKIVLPKGKLEIEDNKKKEVKLSNNEKVSVINQAIQAKEKMLEDESKKELELILKQTSFYNAIIEKAIEKFEKIKPDIEEKIKKASKSSFQKLNREIEKELKKAEKANDQETINHLNQLRNGVLPEKSSISKINSILLKIIKTNDALRKKYDPLLISENIKLLEVFDSEIKKAEAMSDQYYSKELYIMKVKYLKPEIEFLNAEKDNVRGDIFLRIWISVRNRKIFSDDFFKVPPNTKLEEGRFSRFSVDIYDGNDKNIYGYTSVNTQSEMEKYWFAYKEGEELPEKAYIVLRDHILNIVHKSEPIEIRSKIKKESKKKTK